MEKDDVLSDAVRKGELWLVKKYMRTESPHLLKKAVEYGKFSIVEYILTFWLPDLVSLNELLFSACQQGWLSIAGLLIDKKADVNDGRGRALIVAIENGHASLVNLLINRKVDFHVDREYPLMLSVRMNRKHIVKLLLQKGADANTRVGLPMIEACVAGFVEIAQLLIDVGKCDVSLQDDKALQIAAKDGNVALILLLLRAGADLSILNSMSIDESTQNVIQSVSIVNKLVRLRKAVKDAFQKQDFKWEEYCKPCTALHKEDLEEQALFFDVNVEKPFRKRSTCAELAIRNDQLRREVKSLYSITDTDLSGTLISELPFWKVFRIENIPFNVFDLFKMLDNGMFFNPYTKNPLPIDVIRAKRLFLSKTLTRAKFKDRNILAEVRDAPLPSEKALLRQRLEEKVWNRLFYPPDISIIMDAEDADIDRLVDKIEITLDMFNRNRQIGWTYYEEEMYPMVTDLILNAVRYEDGFEKKKLFVDILVSIADTVDSNTETRLMTMTLFFKDFATELSEQNDERPYLSFDEEEDLMTYF